MKEINPVKALEATIRLWTWLAEDGERDKADYYLMLQDEEPGTEIPKALCPLCQYAEDIAEYRREHSIPSTQCCVPCPYFQKYGRCMDGDSPYYKWAGALAHTTREAYAEERKGYAKEFLARVENVLQYRITIVD